MDKSPDAFRTISEVAEDLDLPQHVLRFWETRFSQIKPMKRTGGRRYYRPADVETVQAIKSLLYGQGYTIKGVQKLFKDNGIRAVVAAAQGGGPLTPAQAALALGEEGPEATPPDPDEIEQPIAEPAPGRPGGSNDRAATDRVAALAAELAECARILRAARNG
jgi:DNA-binding transcriptional MerR regulator